MEEFIASFGSSPWGPMALAFILGVGFGWLVWGASPAAEEGAARAIDEKGAKEIVVIKAEIEAAKSMMNERDEGAETVDAQLSSLNDAFKSANENLRRALTGVRRNAGSSRD